MNVPKFAARTAELSARALALHRSGRLNEARGLYGEVLTRDPRHFDALHLSGLIEAQTGNPRAAAQMIGRALEVDPRNPAAGAAHGNLGAVFKQLKRFDAALACLDRAIALRPDLAEPLVNRGVVLGELRRWSEALASYDAAIAIDPRDAVARYNRGNALRELGRLEEAVAGYDQALARKGDYAEAYLNRGNVLQELGRRSEAFADYERAIAARAQLAEAHTAKAMALLSMGELSQGFKLYEWRWKQRECAAMIAPLRNLERPLWLGNESLAGKSILIHSEQGLGDAIQYVRYVERLAALGAEVVMEAQKPLLPLFSRLPGVRQLVEVGEPLPDTDYHCPFMSLSLAFGTRLDSIPAPRRYLECDASQVARWQARLGERSAPRVGLVWSGNPSHRHDRARSIPLAQLLAQLPPGLQYVSLQKELREGDEPLLRTGPQIRDCRAELIDFSETAALCECLDLVISVDTSVAHLSCALGRETWILLAFNSDWRWLLERTDSPWYPTARLYRQTARNDWSTVLGRIRNDLTSRRATPDAA